MIKRWWWCWAVGLIAMPAFAAKSGSTYYTPAEREIIKSRAASGEFAGQLEILAETAALIADRSDEEIWALVPAPDLPRAYNVHFGQDCPLHGKEIHRHGGHYPWLLSAERTNQVTCPVGGESYPNPEYPDDGSGWVSPEGARYYFVGYYNFWWTWRRTLVQGAEACARLYLAMGERRYAHKAAVVLARLSQVYPRLDFDTQGVSDGKHPSGWPGRISDRIWENGLATALARTYDAVYETLGEDRELQDFARERGVPDIAGAVERDILQVQVADIFARKIRGNKFELGTLSTLALVLQNDNPANGATTRQMIDWLLHEGGELEYIFYNGFDRDGIGGESSPGYSEIWNERFVEAAENLARLGVDIIKDPKWLRIAKGPAELQVLGRMGLRIGDSGGGMRGVGRRLNADLLRFGVGRFADPDSANWLLQLPKPTPRRAPPAGMSATADDRLFARSLPTENELRKLANLARFPASPYSRVLGGYGLAILEQDDGRDRHAATLYFGGPASWHQHFDRLNFGYFVGDREALAELGYPSHWGPTAELWVKNTPSHYAVMIDGCSQPQRLAGHLTGFAALDGLKVASADGRAAWNATPLAEVKGLPKKPAPKTVRAYQRSLALLDTGEQSSLLIDVFLAQGGSRHDYSFHGLAFGTLQHGLELVRSQSRGTLAGDDIGYGADPGDERRYSGYQYLKTPRWHAPQDVTELGWREDRGLSQTTWFPRFSFDDVIIAEGVPPLGPGFPASLPFVLLRHEGEALTSLFVSITEVSREGSRVRAVRRIAADQPAAGGFEVEMVSGRLWTVYANESGAMAGFADGTKSSVQLAVVRTDGMKTGRVQLVGAGTFASRAWPETIALEPVRHVVQDVDYTANRATLDRAFDNPGAHGAVVTVRQPETHPAYTVRSAEGRRVGFGEVGLIVGRLAGAWDPERNALVATERIDGEYSQFSARRFVGLAVLDAQRKFVTTITAEDRPARAFQVAAPAAAAERLAAHGERAYFYLADVAPGAVLESTPTRTVGAAN